MKNLDKMVSTLSVPASVANLWHDAQVSHRGMVDPSQMLSAIRGGGGAGSARQSVAFAVQESEPGALVDLMIDKVIDGKALHKLIATLHADGSIRRNDLVEWSSMFA